VNYFARKKGIKEAKRIGKISIFEAPVSIFLVTPLFITIILVLKGSLWVIKRSIISMEKGDH